MPITPPECKTCGIREWRHLCMGPATADVRVAAAKALLATAKPSKGVGKPKRAKSGQKPKGKRP